MLMLHSGKLLLLPVDSPFKELSNDVFGYDLCCFIAEISCIRFFCIAIVLLCRALFA